MNAATVLLVLALGILIAMWLVALLQPQDFILEPRPRPARDHGSAYLVVCAVLALAAFVALWKWGV